VRAERALGLEDAARARAEHDRDVSPPQRRIARSTAPATPSRIANAIRTMRLSQAANEGGTASRTSGKWPATVSNGSGSRQGRRPEAPAASARATASALAPSALPIEYAVIHGAPERIASPTGFHEASNVVVKRFQVRWGGARVASPPVES
jgi:hypothetical protein